MLYYQKKNYESNDFDYDSLFDLIFIIKFVLEWRKDRVEVHVADMIIIKYVYNSSKSNMRERAESSWPGVKLQMNDFQVQMWLCIIKSKFK